MRLAGKVVLSQCAILPIAQRKKRTSVSSSIAASNTLSAVDLAPKSRYTKKLVRVSKEPGKYRNNPVFKKKDCPAASSSFVFAEEIRITFSTGIILDTSTAIIPPKE